MMSSQHREPARTFRPGAVYEDAQDVLAERQLGIQDLLIAALNWFVADPAAALKVLEPHWPEPRPRGRPKRE